MDDERDSKTPSYFNGEITVTCPVWQEWNKARESMEKVSTIHDTTKDIQEDLKHLGQIARTLEDMKGKVIDTILGREIVPVGVTHTMLEEQRKSYVSIIRTLCAIFAVIIMALVGLKYFSPSWFIR